MATSAWRTRAGNLSPSDDESAIDEDVVVVFDSSSEEDSDGVFTGSDSEEEEESSDDTMASAREWYRIDPDSSRKSCTKKKGRPGCLLNIKRFDEHHFPSYIPATEKKQEPTRRCVVCYLKRDRNGEKHPQGNQDLVQVVRESSLRSAALRTLSHIVNYQGIVHFVRGNSIPNFTF
ncbi:hypothetical protein MTO96_012177 [Rhipicephalus appendiculatus]